MDIGQLLTTFGSGGIFIYYLLNREKVVSERIEKKLGRVADSLDDFSLLLFDLLDTLIPNYSEKRNASEVQNRIHDRKNDKT